MTRKVRVVSNKPKKFFYLLVRENEKGGVDVQSKVRGFDAFELVYFLHNKMEDIFKQLYTGKNLPEIRHSRVRILMGEDNHETKSQD